MVYDWLLGNRSSLDAEEISSIEQGVRNIVFQWFMQDVDTDVAQFKLDLFLNYIISNSETDRDRTGPLLSMVHKSKRRISQLTQEGYGND